jgi:hypothetical protein
MNLSLAQVARALSETVNGEKMPRDDAVCAEGLDASLTYAAPWVYRSTLFQPVQPAWEGGACLLREAHARRGAGGAACVPIDPPGDVPLRRQRHLDQSAADITRQSRNTVKTDLED